MAHRWKCIPQLWRNTSVLKGNLRNIFRTHNVKMVWWIRADTENWSVIKNGLIVTIIYRTTKMLHTHKWKCHVLKPSLSYWLFVGRTQNSMECEVLEKIIIFDLTPNWVMKNLQCDGHPVHVWHVPTLWTSHGTLVWPKTKKCTNNLFLN